MPKDKSISRRELLTITSVTAAYALMSKTALGKEPKTVETIQDVIRSQLPGRLGDPNLTLVNDSRADPRITAIFQSAGVSGFGLEPIPLDASIERCRAWLQRFEEESAKQNEALFSRMPQFDDIDRTTEVITGVDGNQIMLFLHRPKQVGDSIPCIVHAHGGGMVLTSAADPLYVRWRNELARSGCLVIGVEFRNAAGRLGDHPFPAGLNDCASALQWANAKRTALGVSNLLISGESGGGNLALATVLKAKYDGWIEQIDGVFALCPDISCKYLDAEPQLLSLKENEGYIVDTSYLGPLLSRVYDPTGENAMNPLAWPYYAEPSNLAGLPPHVISVNELDPLRDEGLAYYRKLVAAGVPAVGRIVAGTPHGADIGLPDVIPEVFRATVGAVASFAKGIALQSR